MAAGAEQFKGWLHMVLSGQMMLPLGVLKKAADAKDEAVTAIIRAPRANPALSARLPDIGGLDDREGPKRERAQAKLRPAARLSGRIDGSRSSQSSPAVESRIEDVLVATRGGG
jgi:hypothetical protein